MSSVMIEVTQEMAERILELESGRLSGWENVSIELPFRVEDDGEATFSLDDIAVLHAEVGAKATKFIGCELCTKDLIRRKLN